MPRPEWVYEGKAHPGPGSPPGSTLLGMLRWKPGACVGTVKALAWGDSSPFSWGSRTLSPPWQCGPREGTMVTGTLKQSQEEATHTGPSSAAHAKVSVTDIAHDTM